MIFDSTVRSLVSNKDFRAEFKSILSQVILAQLEHKAGVIFFLTARAEAARFLIALPVRPRRSLESQVLIVTQELIVNLRCIFIRTCTRTDRDCYDAPL